MLFGGRSMSPLNTKTKSTNRQPGSFNTGANSATRSPARTTGVQAPTFTYKGNDPKSGANFSKAQLKTK